MRRYYLIVAGLILFGLGLRLYNFTHIPFDFDQVQIAQAADQILAGDLTLIGPRTGPAAMFTGPLIYYLTAGFGLLMPTPFALIATTTLISCLTGLSFFFLGHRYLTLQQALVITALWAFSPLLVHLDRIPWNPNLSVLASALVFFPSLKIPKGLCFSDIILVSVGVFLGYQAHFSGLILLPLFLLLYLSLSPHKQLLGLVLPSLALGVTLIPTVLFDYRHDWLNSRGLTRLLFNQEQVSSFNIWPRIWEKIQIGATTFGATLFNQSTRGLVLTAGISSVMGWFYVYFHSRNYARLVIVTLWLGTIVTAYAYYRESTPEYYFLILLPVFFYLFSDLLIKIFPIKLVIVLLTLLAVQTTILTYDNFHLNRGLNLKTQLATVEALHQTHLQTPISQVIFEMDILKDMGLNYLLNKQPLSYSETGRVVRIIHPAGADTLKTQQISADTVLWIDPRRDINRKYIGQKTYILSYPNYWSIYEIHHQGERFDSDAGFIIFDQDHQLLGKILMFDRKNHSEFVAEIEQQAQTSPPLETSGFWRNTHVFSTTDLIGFHQSNLWVITDINPQLTPQEITLH